MVEPVSRRNAAKNGFLVAALLALAACQSTKPLPPAQPGLFAEATRGFTRCELGDLFIDAFSQTTSNPYLRSVDGQQCGTTDTLSSFCINEAFHGLPVRRLDVPNDTWPIFALYFAVPIEQARAKLLKSLGSEFRPSVQSKAGLVPELAPDPNHAAGSVLVCTKEF